MSGPLSKNSPLNQGKAAIRRMILPQPGSRTVTFRESSPLVVAGMFRTGNGIGRAARSCYEALNLEGLSPQAVDLSEMFHQIETDSVVPLSPMPRSSSGTLILFANAPETERALMGLGLRRWHDWRIIGAWAWELPVGPTSWARQARMLSEVWYPSQYVCNALDHKMGVPHRIVPHFVPAPAKPNGSTPLLRAEANDGVRLRVLSIADGRSSLPRKNLLSAIRMFTRAFSGSEKAELYVKCRNLDHFPEYEREVLAAAAGDPRIHVIDRTLPQEEHEALMARSDVVISPHRAEGFGLNLAEAMACGKAVIATGWSGNLEFMNAQNSILLPYQLAPVKDPSGIYSGFKGAQWAEAEIDAGAKSLRELYESPSSVANLAEAARSSISRTLISDRYTDALFGRDDAIARIRNTV
jgi:glycosyltransferase involved in cell wall biosynthesis